MVRHAFKILQRMLQEFQSVADHFRIKSLTRLNLRGKGGGGDSVVETLFGCQSYYRWVTMNKGSINCNLENPLHNQES